MLGGEANVIRQASLPSLNDSGNHLHTEEHLAGAHGCSGSSDVISNVGFDRPVLSDMGAQFQGRSLKADRAHSA